MSAARFLVAPSLRRTVLRLALGWLACAGAMIPVARAYVLEGTAWPLGSPIVLNLQLGTPSAPLIDGSTTWNQVAVTAANVWNPNLANNVQFQFNYDVFTPRQGDARNTVFFNDKIYGESFGGDTLAVTLLSSDTGVTTQVDVVVNSAKPFDSYRGDLRTGGGGGALYDLRRVLIHEFGHVLGLDHTAQGSQSIMAPVITNIDTVQADDIAGVSAIYANVFPLPVIYSQLTYTGITGESFQYRILATNEPSRYTATGLPGGLSVNQTTGYITGVATEAGVFAVPITASTPYRSASATVTITIGYRPVFGPVANLTAIVGIPFYHQVIASHATTYNFGSPGTNADGLVANTGTGVIYGIPIAPAQLNYSLSASNAVATAYSSLVVKVIYDGGPNLLHTFTETEGRPIFSALTPASDGNFYGTAVQGGVHAPNGSPGNGCVFRVTPSGEVTFLHFFNSISILNNADGLSPSGGVIEGRDGNLYGTTAFGGATGNGTFFRMTKSGELSTLYNFPAQGGGMGAVFTPLAQGRDGNFYGSTRSNAINKGTLFKITPDGTYTLLHTFAITTSFYPDGEDPSGLVEANDGNFYGTSAYGGATGNGTIFRVTPDGVFSTVYTFVPGVDVHEPLGTPVLAPDGNLYGTTDRLNNSTNFYRYTPNGDFTVLHVLNSTTEGQYPANLIRGSDGFYYGIGTRPALPYGYDQVLGKYAPDGAFVEAVHTFTTAEGVPRYAMTRAADGSFYGVTDNNNLLRIIPGQNLPTRTYASVVATTPNAHPAPAAAGIITVRRDGGTTNGPLTVRLSSDGDARPGVDYIALPATVTIPDGVGSVDCRIVGLNPSLGDNPAALNLHVVTGDGYLVNPNAHDAQVQVYGSSVTDPPAPFFAGEIPLAQGVYFLVLPSGKNFGYYTYLSDPRYIYHFDMGFEYWFDAADGHGGIYFYDFGSGDFFYTSPTFSFPYLYDFTLQAFLYYFPSPYDLQRYNTNNVRYFYNFSTGKTITR